MKKFINLKKREEKMTIMKKAIDLDWRNISFFNISEWPEVENESVLNWMDAKLILEAIVPWRKLSGVGLIPSPVAGAHVRHNPSNSQHSTKNKTRLSTGSDFFVRLHNFQAAFATATHIPVIGGIGVNFGRKYQGVELPQIHVDIRPMRLYWVATKEGRYVYLQSDPKGYFEELARGLS